jgi:transcription elongation GreA/GreB family factor
MKETQGSGDQQQVVHVGCRITIKNTETGEVSDFTIIPHGEAADPAAGRISAGSPLAQAILGHGAGKIAAVPLRDGVVSYEIIAVQSGDKVAESDKNG